MDKKKLVSTSRKLGKGSYCVGLNDHRRCGSDNLQMKERASEGWQKLPFARCILAA